MVKIKDSKSRIRKFGYGGLLLTALLLAGITIGSSADRKAETIDATAMGTSTQLGKNVSVKVTIYELSTPEDRQVLVDAFKKGQNQDLVNALTKMKFCRLDRDYGDARLRHQLHWVASDPRGVEDSLYHQPSDSLR